MKQKQINSMLHALCKEGYHLTHAPGEQHEAGIGPQNAATHEGDGAIREGCLIPAPKIPPSPGNPPKPEQPRYKTIQGWKSGLELPKVLFEIIAIPFAVGYAIVTYCQWQDLHDNFEVSQRAYVMISDVEAHLLENRPYIKISLDNYGHLPSRRFVLVLHVTRRLPGSLEAKKLVTSDFSLGGDDTYMAPGEKRAVFGVDVSGVPVADLTSIESGEEGLSMAGRVVYDIGVGSKSKTDIYGFCMTYFPKSPDPSKKWASCPVFATRERTEEFLRNFVNQK